jgi:hypothetical protein
MEQHCKCASFLPMMCYSIHSCLFRNVPRWDRLLYTDPLWGGGGAEGYY